MKINGKFLLCFFSAMLFLGGLPIAAGASDGEGIPKLPFIVNDFAHLVDDKTNRDITNLALYLDRDTGAELTIVTLNTSQPFNPAVYTEKIFDQWQKGRDQNCSAVLLALYVIEREFRIKVSPAVGRYLPEKYTNDLVNRMFFYLNHGDVSGGLFFVSAVLSKSIQDQAPYPLTYYALKPGELLISFVLLVSVLLVFLIVTGFLIATFYKTGTSAY